MNLYRFRIIPESPWRTPWQSDTLSGLLCWMCARTHGKEVLRERLIEPALAGRPPFVLSDAFPRDRLPLPAALRTLDVPAELRKPLKRAQWLLADTFRQLQAGIVPGTGAMLDDPGIIEYTQLRNTISRSSHTTSNDSGLFPTEEAVLKKGIRYLTVYARIVPEFVEFFEQLIEELAQWGFGSDRTAGKGQFRLDKGLEPVTDLDQPADADGCVVLSTFQPGNSDPTEGAWEAFTKYGKLGPDFGLENVFKKPIIVFRPGASFRQCSPRGWLGHAIPMHDLFARDIVNHLEGLGAHVIHWAFGLSVPLRWPKGEIRPSELIVEPLAADEKQEAPNITPEFASKPAPSAPTVPTICHPPRPPTQDTDQVTVKVLERREINGKVQYFVQEEGKPRGVLAYGVPPPPDRLPQVGEEIRVYRNNRDLHNPQYRWDKPRPPRTQSWHRQPPRRN